MGNKKRTYPRRDLKNQQFGKLQVIEFIDYLEDNKNRRHDYWLCHCECGNTTKQKGNTLITGKVKSCGCLLKAYYQYCKGRKGYRSLPEGEAALNDLYSRYKYRAERVIKVKFSLTKEEFKSITQKNCTYCGSTPSLIFNKASKSYNGSYIYNGIDRIDNTKGYELTNVTSACKICNQAKLDLSKEEFLQWIQKIVNFHTK